jgi:glucose-6-phosphate isomerase
MLVDLSDCPQSDPLDLGAALDALAALESGAIANPDEGRMVGHYWLRDPERAPTPELQQALRDCERSIAALETGNHDTLLWIGIGGSVLGPQLLHRALSSPADTIQVHFLDNVDPHGITRTLSQIDPSRTLVVVVSKSGSTIETRCALAATETWWAQHSEPLAPHAIAITARGSVLDARVHSEGWRASLPIWDWVGGRVSVTGTVGQVLMQLCGWDREALLAGARDADSWGRSPAEENPAAQIAGLLHQQCAHGTHALVVQPYSDALSLLGRYLQQLLMESLGKELNRQGEPIGSGILVLGTKGSTDQHSLMQQVLDGSANALCCFVDLARRNPSLVDSQGRPLADHLFSMLEGTRTALRQRGRPSLLVQLPAADAHGLGLVIGLFERVVGIWAELLDINAYHQPAVESGKKAAGATLELLDRIEAMLTNEARRAPDIAAELGEGPHQCWRLLHHLAETGRARTTRGPHPRDDEFSRRDNT